MDKNQVAEILLEIGTLLELKGENPFKTRAYANGARTLELLTEPLDKIIAEERLGDIKGIGDALQKKITELMLTGRLAYYEELKASIPPGLFEMIQIPGVGPKKVKALHDQLGIATVLDLETACKNGSVAELAGFGAKTAAKILEGISFRRTYSSRHLLFDALQISEPLLERLREHPEVIRCSTAGSLRRFKEIIGDIDFVVSSKKPADIIEAFCATKGIINTSARGETKASVVFDGGIQADLRVVSDAEFPFALAYFTGSKEHNIVMRQRAIQRGLRLNEYGLFKSEVETRDPALLVKCVTEEEIFEKLGLSYVAPELREDHGEFAASEGHSLPRLVEWTELRGSLHNHTNWSDGRDTLEEVVDHMQELGCDYWAITDHSRSSVQAHGLEPERLRKQIAEIKAINQRLTNEGIDFQLLTGIEVDILKDRLDYEDDLLAQLDIVVASLHGGFSPNEADNTKRLVMAAQNKFVHTIGHPTGRLLLSREPYKVNQEAVIDACAATGTWIELNASPSRCDMDWRLWPYAKSKGVRCVINCDAHRLEHAAYLRLGAGLARKGWLQKEDIINTRTLAQLRVELKRKRNA